jgi:hypothetical protein
LVRHARKIARELGFEEIDAASDPPAEGYYAAMGALRTG